jgi:hypothetical protein
LRFAWCQDLYFFLFTNSHINHLRIISSSLHLSSSITSPLDMSLRIYGDYDGVKHEVELDDHGVKHEVELDDHGGLPDKDMCSSVAYHTMGTWYIDRWMLPTFVPNFLLQLIPSKVTGRRNMKQ